MDEVKAGEYATFGHGKLVQGIDEDGVVHRLYTRTLTLGELGEAPPPVCPIGLEREGWDTPPEAA